MKKFSPVQSNGMLAIKVKYPDKNLCKTIDLIANMLNEYGDFKIVDFGLSYSNFNDNYLKFNTNLPWCEFEK